jgi:uridine phosphorylase
MGLEVAVRIGTCGALDGELALGDLIAAREALAADGTSRALGAGDRVAGDPELAAALAAAAGRAGIIATTDVFYDRDPTRAREWVQAGAVAVEMEAATLFRVAELRGIRAGCVLAVSDTLTPSPPTRARLDADGLAEAGHAVGRAAATALGIPSTLEAA